MSCVIVDCLGMNQNRMQMEENDLNRTKTIVDVNVDCLEHVFKFLDFEDLINVADANKELKMIAEMVFVRKLKKRMIVVDIKTRSCDPNISTYDNAIHIHQSLLAAKTMRIFGQIISEIYLRITKDSENSDLRENFFRHVNEYCHKTLIVLHIMGDYSKVFGAIKYPFENVEKFSSYEGKLGPGCEYFPQIFPRLRQLAFTDDTILDANYIWKKFPNLDTFVSYYSYGIPMYSCFDDRDLRKFVASNLQLQSMTLVGYNPYTWEHINAKLKSLKCVHISFSPKLSEYFKGTPIQFDTVEICKVSCDGILGTASPVDVFSFKRLKHLTVKCFYNQLEMWLDFILAHPTIEEVILWFTDGLAWPFHLEYIEKSREKLSRMRQNTKYITVRMHRLTFDDLHINVIPTFLETSQWFDKFSVAFDYYHLPKCISELELFCGRMPQIKNYKMTKTIKTYVSFGYKPHEIFVNFEKCK